MSVLTEEGVEYLKAPYFSVTEPGTKRFIYTHTDCIFVTVHATEETDIKKIEDNEWWVKTTKENEFTSLKKISFHIYMIILLHK